MVTHIVMFKLRGEADEVAAAASKFKAGLEALPAKIAERLNRSKYLSTTVLWKATGRCRS